MRPPRARTCSRERGDLDIDAPVARYWPEFAQAGKERVPVRWLLCHKVGLPAFDAAVEPGAVFQWDPIVEALAAQAPYWEPGTAHGYHAVTYGFLVGEVVRRISGKSLGTFFHDEIATPLDLEFWIGLPEEHEPRVAPLIGGLAEPGEDRESPLTSLLGGDSLTAKAFNLNGAFGDSSTGRTRASTTPRRSRLRTASPTRARWRACMPALIGTVDGGPAEPLLTRDQVDPRGSARPRAPTASSRSPRSVWNWRRRSRSGSGARTTWAASGAWVRSVIPAREARSASQIPRTGSPVAT